jgi:hypothetical protein
MKITLTALITMTLWAYCIVAFFDPGDSIARAKMPLFALALLLFLALQRYKPAPLPRDLLYRTFLLALVIPAAGLALFAIRHPGQGLAAGLSLAKGMAALLLILPVAAAEVDLRKPALACVGLMAASIIGLRFCAVSDPALYSKISLFLVDHQVARIGARQFGEVDVMMIYFATTPLVIIAVPFLMRLIFGEKAASLKRAGALIFLAMILAAVLFSAARALTAVLLLECFACFLFLNRRRLMLSAWSLALAGIIGVTGLVLVQRTVLLSSDEQSNSIKISHFQSFTDFIGDHPGVLLTGDGLGAAYYTYALEVNQEVYQTELTYLDTVRYFGLFGSLIFLGLLFLPLWPPAGSGLAVIGLASYLIVAGNNPLLFNSTGMLAIVYFWSRQAGSGQAGQAAPAASVIGAAP